MSKDQQNFEQLIQEAYERIPEVFREACSDVIIRAEAVPSVEVLTALAISDAYHLLGLYHGVNLTQKSVLDVNCEPDMVLIYRKPIVAYSKATGIPLKEVVEHVLVHELGHHLGYSDADMEAIELSREKIYDTRQL